MPYAYVTIIKQTLRTPFTLVFVHILGCVPAAGHRWCLSLRRSLHYVCLTRSDWSPFARFYPVPSAALASLSSAQPLTFYKLLSVRCTCCTRLLYRFLPNIRSQRSVASICLLLSIWFVCPSQMFSVRLFTLCRGWMFCRSYAAMVAFKDCCSTNASWMHEMHYVRTCATIQQLFTAPNVRL